MRIATRAAAIFAALLALAGPAQASCRINITVINDEPGAVELLNAARYATDVRVRRGPWRALRAGGWFDEYSILPLRRGERRRATFRADLGCNEPRSYRVEYRCLHTPQRRVVRFPNDPTRYPSSTNRPQTTRDRSVTIRLSGIGCRGD